MLKVLNGTPFLTAWIQEFILKIHFLLLNSKNTIDQNAMTTLIKMCWPPTGNFILLSQLLTSQQMFKGVLQVLAFRRPCWVLGYASYCS